MHGRDASPLVPSPVVEAGLELQVQLGVYFDLTCGYSYRAWLWLERTRAQGTQLDIDWLPFVLKEVNRKPGDRSLLSGPEISSVAVLALALGEALRGTEGADTYRAHIFEAMHGGDERPSRDDIFRAAAEAGLDPEAFRSEESSWLSRVRDSHQRAVSAQGVFGTPTVVVDDSQALYLKLRSVPREDDGHLLSTILALTSEYPEVAELKRPTRSE
jgi:2-hydroxychromene-2-carboxylate isomerase